MQIGGILDSLPGDLSSMYGRILEQNAASENVGAELQLLILETITHATRPLRLLELGVIVQRQTGLALGEAKSLARRACGPLVEVIENETCHICHHSCTEYLTQPRPRTYDTAASVETPILDPRRAQYTLALLCLTTLTEMLEKEDQSGNLSLKRFLEYSISDAELCMRYPLFAYAAKSWSSHLHKLEIASEQIKDAIHLFSVQLSTQLRTRVSKKSSRRQSQSFQAGDEPTSRDVDQTEFSSLHVAAYAGIRGCDTR